MSLDKRIRQNIGWTELCETIDGATHGILHRDVGIHQNLNGIGELTLDTNVGFGVKEVNQDVREGCFLLVDSFEHIAAHGDGVVIQQRD